MSAEKSSNRTHQEGSKPWHNHTLDLEAIAKAQVNNAAYFHEISIASSDNIKKMREEHGVFCGYKLEQEDMAWLGAGFFSASNKMVTTTTSFRPFGSSHVTGN